LETFKGFIINQSIWWQLVLFLLAILFVVQLRGLGAKRTHWLSALVEVLLIWIFSNIPIFLSTLGKWMEPDSSQYNTLLFDNLGLDKALIFVTAILSTVLYISIMNLKEEAILFLRINLIGILACYILSVYIFARTESYARTDQEKLMQIGIFLYFASIIFWYFSVVFNKIFSAPDPGRDSQERADDIRANLQS